MKRRTLCAALLALLLALCPAALADSWEDAGNYDTGWYDDAETVFHISTPAQLAGLAKRIGEGTTFAGKTIYLDADPDMSAHEWFCKGVSPFMGTFDGLGHTVSGLKMDGQYTLMGLFGWLQGAKVQNLSIEKADLTTNAGGGRFGLLAAVATENTLIRNCTTSGSVNVNKSGNGRQSCCIGGLAGETNGLTVQACASGAELNCDLLIGDIYSYRDYMGGIIGYCKSNQATVQHCVFSGTIHYHKNSSIPDAFIGGMIGFAVKNYDINISGCLMLGSMEYDSGGSMYFSRIAGNVSDGITNCYYDEPDNTPGIDNNGATKMKYDEISTPGFLAMLQGDGSSGVVWTSAGGKPMPGFELASYTEVDAAIAEAKEKAGSRDAYLDFSAVDAALKAVVRNLRSFDQDQVTGMAQAINKAIAALVRSTPDVAGLPNTGDTSQLPLWGALALGSLLALAALRRRSGARS